MGKEDKMKHRVKSERLQNAMRNGREDCEGWGGQLVSMLRNGRRHLADGAIVVAVGETEDVLEVRPQTQGCVSASLRGEMAQAIGSIERR